jgi:hypothetical protein
MMGLSFKSLDPRKQIPASLGIGTGKNFFGGVLGLSEDNFFREMNDLFNPVDQMSEHGGNPFGGWSAMKKEQSEKNTPDYFAAKNSAGLIRSQWEDYKARFKPIEMALMNETTYNNPRLVGQAVAEGTAAVDSAYAVGRGMDDRTLRRLGMTRSSDEQAAYERGMNLSQTAERVDAAGRIRQGLEDRDRAIATGSIPNAGRAYGLRSEN